MIVGTKFQLKLTIFIYCTILAPKGSFWSKIDRENAAIKISILKKTMYQISAKTENFNFS